MKKISVLLAALMLVMAMLPGSAMAYNPAELPAPEKSTFPHALKLTYVLNRFDHEDAVIMYKYTVGAVKKLNYTSNTEYSFDTDTTPAPGVSGSPVIVGNHTVGEDKSYVVFNNSSIFNEEKISTVTVQIDWSKVSITEPGFYVWPLTKELVEDSTTVDPTKTTNNGSQRYLYAIVTRQGENLVALAGISQAENLSLKKGDVEDQYPAVTLNLTLTKAIEGNMASANQYFPFKITVNTTPGTEYKIKGIPAKTQPTAYNTELTNDTLIEVNAEGYGEATINLKAGDIAVIEGLPFGSSYTIYEILTNISDYQVSAKVEGDTSPNVANVPNDKTVTDEEMTANTNVTYTNKKESAVPAGIALHTAAPMMGILLAMSLLAILFIGKRKESAV